MGHLVRSQISEGSPSEAQSHEIAHSKERLMERMRLQLSVCTPPRFHHEPLKSRGWPLWPCDPLPVVIAFEHCLSLNPCDQLPAYDDFSLESPSADDSTRNTCPAKGEQSYGLVGRGNQADWQLRRLRRFRRALASMEDRHQW
ncbi:hypothetical protein LIA77_00529 [Sarocladium implicatum]|nr:hypothetical protein LIA77_00529 [Sarocladium implicatum]